MEGEKMVNPAHSSLLIHNFLTEHETMLVPQPPYSPDLGTSGLLSLQQAEIHNGRMTI
jgi:transposase